MTDARIKELKMFAEKQVPALGYVKVGPATFDAFIKEIETLRSQVAAASATLKTVGDQVRGAKANCRIALQHGRSPHVSNAFSLLAKAIAHLEAHGHPV